MRRRHHEGRRSHKGRGAQDEEAVRVGVGEDGMVLCLREGDSIGDDCFGIKGSGCGSDGWDRDIARGKSRPELRELMRTIGPRDPEEHRILVEWKQPQRLQRSQVNVTDAKVLPHEGSAHPVV